jgi:hypothetical protein
MLPIIGIMMGLYIVTRMVEVVAPNKRKVIKIFSTVALAGNVLGIAFLALSGRNFGESKELIGTSSSTGIDIDSLVASNRPAAPTWTVNESINPVDDSPTAVLSLEASSGTSRMGTPPSLYLRCSSKKTDAFINWHDFMGSDEVSVTSRLGKNEAQTRTWSLSTDNTATFYPGSAVQFIKALAAVDTVVFRSTPYNESPVTAVFAVKGLAEKLGPLQKACGWTMP